MLLSWFENLTSIAVLALAGLTARGRAAQGRFRPSARRATTASTYSYDVGRKVLEEQSGGKVKTTAVENVYQKPRQFTPDTFTG